METPFTNTEIYIQDFNPKDYYDTYYSPGTGALQGEWTHFALKNLHELFSSGQVKGDTMIDIGTGPTIYQLLSACKAFKNIILSDFLEPNRVELKRWLDKEPGRMDWSELVQACCDLEGNSEKCEKKENKLCESVKNILKCDVLKKNPFEPLVLPQVDCLLSCLCLEAACKDVAAYRDTVRNLKDLLKPGGHIILLSMLQSTFYYVGDKRFSGLQITKEDIERAFKEGGYEILRLDTEPRQDMSMLSLSDYETLYLLHARKPCDL
uniref:Nicotinamide N-methyltransferase n=1 Tax=Leptobrachium leishanense TaxID=445787 RepID=A0A8C5Q2R9_9ANUR